jgi:putative oxidoreductase
MRTLAIESTREDAAALAGLSPGHAAITGARTATQETAADIGLLILRITLAVVFVYHGGQKLFGLFGGFGLSGTAQWMASIGIPLPYVSAIAAGSAEFFGGLALLLGLWTRIAAIPMVFTMIVAIVSAHWSKFDARSGGMEYPLTLVAALAALALIGGGRLSITSLFGRASRQ